MSLLPSKPDTSAVEDTGPRVIGVDSDDADDVIAALSSDTARKILAELHDEPAPPSELADRVDTSLQNAQYHLEKLEGAGAIEVIDTAYSAKGREMDVYAPADKPLVIFAGDREQTPTIRSALSSLLGGIGVLGVASLLVQQVFGRDLVTLFGGAPTAVDQASGGESYGAESTGGSDAGAVADNATETTQTTETATETTTQTAAEAPGQTTDTPSILVEKSTTTVEETTRTTTAAVRETTQTTTEAARESGGELLRTTVETTTDLAGPAPTETVTQAGLPPGLLFFAGGSLVLVLAVGVWYLRAR